MRNLFKASLITGSAFFVNLLFNIIRAKIVAVFLGPAGVAVMAQLGGFTNLVVTVCSLGLVTAVVRYVAEYQAEGKKGDLKTLIATITWFVAISGTAATLVLMLLLPTVSRFIFGSEMLLLLIALTLLNIPIAIVTNLAVSLLQGFKEIKLDAMFSVFATIVTGILTIALLIPFKLTGAVVGMLVANYLTSAIFFFFVVRAVNRNMGTRLDIFGWSKSRRHIRLDSLRPLTGIAIASIVGGGIINLSEILIRSNLIQHFNLEVAGSIQPALTFSAQYTGLLSGAIGTYALPRLSELANTNRPIFQKEYNDFIRLMLLVVTPFAIIISVGAKVLVPILYSHRFDTSIPLIYIQSVADVVEFAYIGLAAAFLPMGRGKILLGLGAIVPLSYYGIYLVLLPYLQLKAIPVASALSWALALALTYLILRRLLDLQIRRKNFWLMANSMVATVIVAVSISRLHWIIGVIIGLVVLAIWAAINISRTEWRQAYALIRGRLRTESL